MFASSPALELGAAAVDARAPDASTPARCSGVSLSACIGAAVRASGPWATATAVRRAAACPPFSLVSQSRQVSSNSRASSSRMPTF
eukprot:scaffold7371_cov70-Phaeocystis_antarctica.AAC.2